MKSIYYYNSKNIRKMGCETSRQQNHDIVSLETQEEFKLSYKQLITQDRGHIFQLYHFSTIFNRSNYSIVRKVTSRASQQSRVCKIVPLLNQKYFSVISEVEFLKKLDHPNIIQILEYFLEPSFLYIILEQIPGERLLRELNKVKQGVIFNQVVDIMTQLLRAVDFCHRKQIAHRAITTENIMLFFSDGEPYLKLIDFSQACTIGCSSPQFISNQKRNVLLGAHQENQTQKIDIYDSGIVFYALISGKRIRSNQGAHNYREMSENAVETIKKAGLTKKIQQELISLIKSMLSENPKDRPTASECLNHQFFCNFDKKSCSKKALDSMVKFQPDNNLKYLLSMYASLNMTSAMQKSEHLSQFYSLDKNKDGEIQIEELIEGIQNTYNIDEEKAKNYAEIMFANMDKNKNGTINFSEYVTGTIQLSKLVSHNFLQKMFNEIDINRDGYITEEQLNNLIMGIDRYEVLGGQKKVNFTSFKKMMIKIVSGQNIEKTK